MTNRDKFEVIKDRYIHAVPVDVIGIAEELGIDVYESDFDNNKVSGYISKDDEGNPYICVNKNHSATRQSFTIAHEIGHFVLHEHILDNKSIVPSFYKLGEGINNCVMQRSELDVNSEEYRKNEIQANQFAADLLMPRDEFIKQANLCDSIQELASVFKVSVGAASIRANNLGIEIY